MEKLAIGVLELDDLPQFDIYSYDPRTSFTISQTTFPERFRLIEQLALEIQRELPPTDSQPRRSFWGLCADLGNAPSAEEIDEVRRDVWGSSVQ